MMFIITLAMIAEFEGMVDRLGLDGAVFTAKVNKGEAFAEQMRAEYLAMIERRRNHLDSIEVTDPLAGLRQFDPQDFEAIFA